MCFDIGVVVCGPNEALVISGMFQGGKPTFITGGRAIVCPCIQTVQRITLNTMTLSIFTERVYTSQGVPISVIGTAQVKINGSNREMLEAAAEQFGGKSEEDIKEICLATLEGHQRAIMGNMSVEEIYRDRQTFSTKVFDVASGDLVNMGIMVISYTLKDIRDDVGYLASLGQARTAQVKRDALIGEAEARRDAGIAEATAEEQRMEAKLHNDIDIAKSKRDYELNKANYDTQVNTAKAEAELAYSLQAAIVQARIKEEEMQVKVVEREQNIRIQEQEILRKEKELDSKVRKPAEAEKYRLEKIAEADKMRIVLEAEALAEAKALKGDAEAYAIEALAKAEAEQMAKKADAWKEYKEAAMVDMMLKVLPQIAAEVSGPISQVNKITMVNSGDGPIGASRLTGEILDIMGSLPDTVEKMTGVSISKKLNGRA
jgi:flotillin